MSDGQDDLTDEERSIFGIYNVAEDLAVRCRDLREMKVLLSDRAADEAVMCLMTALWDRNFTQTEIRRAFEAALANMNRYAAGCERRP